MISFRVVVSVLVLGLPLAGCGDGEPAPPPAVYAPLHYEYLARLRLNVGAINVIDHSAPQGDDDVTSQSPVTLGQAAAQMAHDRLFAGGLTGSLDFVIDQASIIRGPGGVLNGILHVHLTLYNAAGTGAGHAEAQVTRQHVPGSDPEDLRGVLYEMTRQMMDDMNVELEYQLRRSLQSWLLTGAPTPAAVMQAPLDAPSPSPLAPPPAQPSIPGVVVVPAPAEPPEPAPQQMSPPPGYLQLPPGGQTE